VFILWSLMHNCNVVFAFICDIDISKSTPYLSPPPHLCDCILFLIVYINLEVCPAWCFPYIGNPLIFVLCVCVYSDAITIIFIIGNFVNLRQVCQPVYDVLVNRLGHYGHNAIFNILERYHDPINHQTYWKYNTTLVEHVVSRPWRMFI
jgi:hypothetical protein